MAKPMTAPAVLRSAMEVGVIPSEAEISRKGEALWAAEGLLFLGWIAKSPSGKLVWNMNVGDSKFGPALERFGRMSVPVRSDQNETTWPSALNETLRLFLENGLGAAVKFVHGREDLCEILRSRENIQRGNLFAWLPVANYPARLVQALILARDLGNAALESQIEEQLKGDPISLHGGNSMDIMASAKRWAKEYSKALGAGVALL